VLTTTQLAEKAKISRYTVEREIRRGNLKAEKLSGRWIVADDEAERWAAQFKTYAEQRDRPQRAADD
jgi:predicted site-specific integrase-resolvase